MNFFEKLSVFIFGAVGYGTIETLWQGHTHWTMLLTGGFCFCIIYFIANSSGLPLWKQSVLCMSIITTVEFVVGVIVNIRLGWEVWDYSYMGVHLMGQICPLYSLFWLLLSLPFLAFSVFLRSKVFYPSRKIPE